MIEFSPKSNTEGKYFELISMRGLFLRSKHDQMENSNIVSYHVISMDARWRHFKYPVTRLKAKRSRREEIVAWEGLKCHLFVDSVFKTIH